MLNHRLQVDDPSQRHTLNYAKKAAAFEWSRQTISDECNVPRYSESPLQEAQSSLAFRAYQAPIRVQVPLAFPAFVGDQPTLYIGAGGIGAITNISDYYYSCSYQQMWA